MRKKIALVMGFMALSLFSGTITAYAAGPGEATSQTVAKPVTYNQQAVKVLGSWEQQGTDWKFKAVDGNYITNSWIESLSEAGAYYFVGADGRMLVNSQTPDGYTVDGNGVWRASHEETPIVQEKESDYRPMPNIDDYTSSQAYYDDLLEWMLNDPAFIEAGKNQKDW